MESVIDKEEILKKKWEEVFVFSVRLSNVLNDEGIVTIENILEHSAQDLLKLRCFGKKSLKELRESLAEKGLSLHSDVLDKEFMEIKRLVEVPGKLEMLEDRLKSLTNCVASLRLYIKQKLIEGCYEKVN